jgi:periplasmic protein TonB
MAALAYPGGPPPGRRTAPVKLGHVLLAGALVLVALVVWNLLGAQLVSKRPNEMKTTTVVLPPPPIVPPPPPEVKPEEKPPEPTDAPPVDQPIDQPVPDKPAEASEASSDPAPGDNALTAREGAGPSNYGLAAGDGSGTRIGGRPGGGGGGDGFAAYAGLTRTAVQVATQADRELARGRYTTNLAITVDGEGRIADVRVLGSSGDSRRDARLRRVLIGLQLSRRPPAGLPTMRVNLVSRPGA